MNWRFPRSPYLLPSFDIIGLIFCLGKHKFFLLWISTPSFQYKINDFAYSLVRIFTVSHFLICCRHDLVVSLAFQKPSSPVCPQFVAPTYLVVSSVFTVPFC